MVTQVSYPTAPVAEKLRSTLLDVATIDPVGIEWHDGQALYQSWNDLVFEGSAAFCGANNKDLDQQAGWVDGVRFAVYGGMTCSTVANSQEEQNAKALAAFERGESHGVERGFMALRIPENEDETADPGGMPGSWPAPVDITPAGGAVSAKNGVALLEEWLGSVYRGLGVLHLPTSVISLLANAKQMEFEGDILRTSVGTKVVNGSGYAYPNLGPDGDPIDPADGERWIYATGQVILQRSEPVAKTAPSLVDNQIITLIERGYILSVDANVVGAIRVNIEN